MRFSICLWSCPSNSGGSGIRLVGQEPSNSGEYSGHGQVQVQSIIFFQILPFYVLKSV